MQRIIRKKSSGLALGIILCLAGLGALFSVLWKAWPTVSVSQNILSALWAYILTEQINVASMMVLKLTYLSIMGVVFLGSGITVVAFSQQVFYLSGESVSLECPYCKNYWKARRAAGWAECPHCHQFIQPHIKKT
jgi:Zn finger protein HypA/HybF involved in hydrogenase expression